MQFDVITQRHSGGSPDYRCINATDELSPLDALVEPVAWLWSRVLDELKGPAVTTNLWDCLFVELWIDGGRVIIYPGPRSREHRIDLFSVQLSIHSVEAAYYELASDGENAFRLGHSKLIVTLRQALQEAYARPEIAAAAAEVRAINPFEIQVLEYDDEETAMTIDQGPSGPNEN